MLTGKQEKFAQLVAKGYTQSDAYREAYDTTTEEGNTVWSNSSQLASDAKVSQRIAELKKEYSQHLKYDAEEHFRELSKLQELALTPRGKDGDIKIAEAIKALVKKGELCGLYVDKKEITSKMTVDEYIKGVCSQNTQS